jgi:predicted secreted acid phosphatase
VKPRSVRTESTLDFFNDAREKNVTVFFITGRPDEPEERATTIDNLKKVGYAGWKELVMRGVGDGCSKTRQCIGACRSYS